MRPRASAGRLAGLIALLAPVAAGAMPLGEYEFKTPLLDTPWTQQVLDELAAGQAPRCEYPRPQMVREQWQCLNGVWEYSNLPVMPPDPALTERILVPFPVESGLSGIMRDHETSFWYRRQFTVPPDWDGQRLLLHFEGVNHIVVASLNGQPIGSHAGTYDAFAFDISDAVNRDGDNTLLLKIVNPGNFGGGQATGKQLQGQPSTVFFNPASGIWQSVWLEPLPAASITRLDQTPDLAAGALRLQVQADNAAGLTARLRVLADGRPVAQVQGPADQELVAPIAQPRLWSPEDPYLYDLEVALLDAGGQVVDQVESYAGMRSIGLAEVEGVTRIVLNGEFVFQMGVLDQGYWPDGLYAAPVDEALRFDIEFTRRLGFNMNRKHVKVEPRRWYYWADRLGLLVWQDFPNMTVYRPVTPDAERQFETELLRMVDQLRSHPSIIMWVPWNEGWGQFDVDRLTAAVAQRDPSRIINGHSGSANCCHAIDPPSSQIHDAHMYPGPWAPVPDQRASVSSEFGVCLGRNPEHEWKPDDPTQFPDRTPSQQIGQLRRQWDALAQQMRTPGLSAAVYVELYDIERETAGFITYDRRVEKCNWAETRRLNQALIAASRTPAGRRPQPPALPPGQSAYWPLDESRGARAQDHAGCRHLELVGGASWTEDAARGSALAFAGDGGHAIAAGPALDTEGSFSVAAWLRHEDAGQIASALSQASGNNGGFQLGLFAQDTREDLQLAYPQFPPDVTEYPPWRWFMGVPDRDGCLQQGTCGGRVSSAYGDGNSYSAQDLKPPAGQWQHVVGVVDRENQSYSVYYNGLHIGAETLPYSWHSDARFALGIGEADAPDNDSFSGAVDEVRLYPRALSSAEVWQLYAYEQATDGPPPAPACPDERSGRVAPVVARGGSLSGLALAGLLLVLLILFRRRARPRRFE